MLPGDMQQWENDLRAAADKLGPDEVQRRLIEGKYGERKGRIIRAWLAEQDAASDRWQRATDVQIAREANEIARAANVLAARAERRATLANWIAIVAAIIALVSAIAAVVPLSRR